MKLPICVICKYTVYLRMNGEWAHSVAPGGAYRVHAAEPLPNEFTTHLLDPTGLHEADMKSTHDQFPVHTHDEQTHDEAELVADIRQLAFAMPMTDRVLADMVDDSPDTEAARLRLELEAMRLLNEAADSAVVQAVNRRSRAVRKLRSMQSVLAEPGPVNDDLQDTIDILEGG